MIMIRIILSHLSVARSSHSLFHTHTHTYTTTTITQRKNSGAKASPMSTILRLGSGKNKKNKVTNTDSGNPILKAPVWQSNLSSSHCTKCKTVKFSLLERRHHCRKCGALVCGRCSRKRALVVQVSTKRLQRVCDDCYDQIVKVEAMEDRSLLHRSLNSDQLLRLRRGNAQKTSSSSANKTSGNISSSGILKSNTATSLNNETTSPIQLSSSPRQSPSPTKDEYTTIRVPVPKNAKAGMFVKIKHEGYVLKVSVPADAAARGNGTFPARIATSQLKEASSFAIATVDRQETIAKLRFEHDHVASQLRDARKQIEKLKKRLESCTCSSSNIS